MIKGKPVYQSEKIGVKPELIAGIQKYLETHNLANRGIEDGDKRKQLVGLLGEIIVIEKLTRTSINLEDRKDGFDGGFDLVYQGKRIDVKTMERKSYVRGEYVNNFYIMQEAYEADIIIFCSYNNKDNIVEICGWIPKKDLPTVGIFYRKGTERKRADGTSFVFRQDNYEVENKDLKPIKELLGSQ
jgi:hypothetical protein